MCESLPSLDLAQLLSLSLSLPLSSTFTFTTLNNPFLSSLFSLWCMQRKKCFVCELDYNLFCLQTHHHVDTTHHLRQPPSLPLSFSLSRLSPWSKFNFTLPTKPSPGINILTYKSIYIWYSLNSLCFKNIAMPLISFDWY